MTIKPRRPTSWAIVQQQLQKTHLKEETQSISSPFRSWRISRNNNPHKINTLREALPTNCDLPQPEQQQRQGPKDYHDDDDGGLSWKIRGSNFPIVPSPSLRVQSADLKRVPLLLHRDPARCMTIKLGEQRSLLPESWICRSGFLFIEKLSFKLVGSSGLPSLRPEGDQHKDTRRSEGMMILARVVQQKKIPAPHQFIVCRNEIAKGRVACCSHAVILHRRRRRQSVLCGQRTRPWR